MYYKMLSRALICILVLQITCQDTLVSAHLKSHIKKNHQKDASDQDRSSNEIPKVEKKSKSADEHLYYLPMQTTFDSPLKPSMVAGGAITSPPSLSIRPSVAETLNEQSSQSVVHNDEHFNDDHITPYLSPCITEIPSNGDQPKSDIPLPSKDLISKSVVLSGHSEIASKTSSELSAPNISNTAVQFLQGTQIHMSSTTDV